MNSNKDYIEDKEAALELLSKLRSFYAKKGYHHLRFWLEPEIQSSGRRFYYIRSSIVFRVPSL